MWYCECGIETAWLEETKWKKPVNCHLFPVVVKSNGKSRFANYQPGSFARLPAHWVKKIESAVYQFLKEPLVRKFGEEFYENPWMQLQIIQEQRCPNRCPIKSKYEISSL
jgi:hypothetical protein